MEIIKFEGLESKLIQYQDEFVLVDSDVAGLYGVKHVTSIKWSDKSDKVCQTFIIALNT